MILEITVDPCITKETKNCLLTIKEKGLEELPNGNYTIWVYLHSHPEIVSNETFLTITDDQTIINFGTLETLNISKLANSMIFLSIILIFVSKIIKKYYRKNQ